jgi:hypothetical protein
MVSFSSIFEIYPNNVKKIPSSGLLLNMSVNVDSSGNDANFETIFEKYNLR